MGNARERNAPVHENPRTARLISRCVGDDDSQDTEAAATAWLCPRPAYQANLERLATDRRRVTLPRSAAPSKGRAGQSRVGHFLHKPSRSYLQADGKGSEASGA